MTNKSRLYLAAAMAALTVSASAYQTLGTKWGVGPNVSLGLASNEGTAGHATWSIMAAGIGMVEDPHGANTLNFGNLVGTSATTEETNMLTAAFATWSAAANITFAMVGDSGAQGGATTAAGGHLGDIRFASFNSGFGGSVLAHAYQPGCESSFGPGWNIGGDTHFNANFTFVDNPNANSSTYDFQTIALHEIGHALGLDHSNVSGSVMEPIYAGSRRSLHSDDIAGMQFIYGAPVPEPATVVALGLGLAMLVRLRRR